MTFSQKRFSVLIGGIFALSLTTTAQSNPTYPFLDQIQVRSGSGPATMLLAIVNGKIATVQLGSGLTLNTSTNPPTLTVSASSALTPQVESYTYTAAATSQTLKFIPVASVPMIVARNGVVLTAGVDYASPASGATAISFTVNGATTSNAPASGDTFVFYYSH